MSVANILQGAPNKNQYIPAVGGGGGGGVASVANGGNGSGITIAGTATNPTVSTNLVAGSGITLTPSGSNSSITIAASGAAGVTSLAATAPLAVSGPTGAVTISSAASSDTAGGGAGVAINAAGATANVFETSPTLVSGQKQLVVAKYQISAVTTPGDIVIYFIEGAGSANYVDFRASPTATEDPAVLTVTFVHTMAAAAALTIGASAATGETTAGTVASAGATFLPIP